MIFVYADKSSVRLEYVLQHIFNSVLNVEYQLTTDEEVFRNAVTPKISYGKIFGSGEIVLPQSSSILFETEISKNSFLNCINNQTADWLALSFLLLSRYQEYLAFTKDQHQRFPFSEDAIFKKFDVEIPLIDEFAHQLKTQILQKFPTYSFPNRKSKIINTIDVDRLWQFKGENPFKLWAKKMKYSLFGSKENAIALTNYSQTKKDPFDTFKYMESVVQKNSLESIYFILMVNHSNKFDNNISPKNLAQQEFLQNLSKKNTIGIHPSYQSDSYPQKIETEKRTLEKLIQKPIEKSRQHYIKLSFPETYRALLNANLKEDYSMGFPDQIGFRAGTSHPFNWFDLEKNEITSLKIFPFSVMDVTLKNYMHLQPEQAKEKVTKIKSQIAKYRGVFIPIFHNQNLSESGTWKGWREVYEHCLKPFEND